jgi:putative phosphoribosyl transferase
MQHDLTGLGAAEESNEPAKYRDRSEAGQFLAARLKNYRNRDDVIVLALPRGGVPVAYEVAKALNAPLDLFIVRKLGVPFFEELAMGAIATGGVRVLNEEVIHRLKITEKIIDAVTREQQEELERREWLYRRDRPPVEIAGKTVVLVDDGLATGSTMRAAIEALRVQLPAAIVVAVPIASADVCRQMRSEAEEIICARTPEPFNAVGQWYDDFTQTTDAEVQDLLNHAAHERRVRQVRKKATPVNH